MTINAAASLLHVVGEFVSAQATVPAADLASPFSLGKVFTFLFLTLGPFKVIGPFAELAHGRDAAFRRELAFRGTLTAVIGTLAAATIGSRILHNWGVSLGALQLTAGVVLFLVALKPVLEQYEGREDRAERAAASVATSGLPAAKLAIWPLAFPTIVTPYGVAVLIMMLTLQTDFRMQILGVAVAVLVLDLVAMLGAVRIVTMPFVGTALAIVGMVLGILQVALGIQAIVGALPMLGLTGPLNG